MIYKQTMLQDTGENKQVSDEEHVVLQVLVQPREVPNFKGSRLQARLILEPAAVSRKVGVVDGCRQRHRLGAPREHEAQVVDQLLQVIRAEAVLIHQAVVVRGPARP